MSREPVTIVVAALDGWDNTRACLDSLRPTLGLRDQVLVVGCGSQGDPAVAALRHYPWVQVVTAGEPGNPAGEPGNPAGEAPGDPGTPAGEAPGEALDRAWRAASHEIVVFLDSHTRAVREWVTPLVAALSQPGVGAAGPVSDRARGPQLAPGATGLDARQIRRFAREWSAAHRGAVSYTESLGHFCLAVRRTVLHGTGGLPSAMALSDADLATGLCESLTAAGYRLAVAEESFVHRDGEGGPLVSACLITKDEEANLSACLESLGEVADEVVVYDTGSTDSTVALARSLGARVVEGYWDDDFSRARNAALEFCNGEWIAWLDADETLVCPSPAALRDLLRRTKPDVDAWSVPIHNMTGAGTGGGFIHHASRLFRRAMCEWSGRIHEQVTRRADHGGISQARLEIASIRHTGYLDEVMRAKDKAERNLRVARAEVDRSDGWEKGFSLTSLARSLMTAGRMEEAYDAADRSLDHTDNPITRRLGLRTRSEALLALGRLDEALEACDLLRRECDEPLQADVTEAKIRLARAEHARVLELLEGVEAGEVDADGMAHTPAILAGYRAEALAGLGRYGEAARTLIAVLSGEGAMDKHLGIVVELLQRAGEPLETLAAAIPNDRSPLFLAQVLQLETRTADAVLEACLTEMGDKRAVLATAATLAKRLPVDRALVWSARLRGAGHPQACPLIAVAASAGPPVLRARAAATAMAAFCDPRAPQAFAAAYASANLVEQGEIRAEAAQLCPQILAGAGEDALSLASPIRG